MPILLRERQRQKARVTGDDFGTSADGYVALDGDERALDARRRRRVGVQTRALAVQTMPSWPVVAQKTTMEDMPTRRHPDRDIDADVDERNLTVTQRKHEAAGVKAVMVSLKRGLESMGLLRTTATLAKLNQRHGFDCPGCAWPEEHGGRKLAEFCENGAKAVAEEATLRTVSPEFFATHSVADLAEKSGYWLGQQGRITHPMVRREGAEHYEPIDWDDAYELIARADISKATAISEYVDVAKAFFDAPTKDKAAFDKIYEGKQGPLVAVDRTGPRSRANLAPAEDRQRRRVRHGDNGVPFDDSAADHPHLHATGNVFGCGTAGFIAAIQCAGGRESREVGRRLRVVARGNRRPDLHDEHDHDHDCDHHERRGDRRASRIGPRENCCARSHAGRARYFGRTAANR